MKHLLSDEAFRSYLIDGYVVIDPVSLGDDFHDFLYQKAEGIYELVKNAKTKTPHLDIIGDNLRAQIPLIDRLLEDPGVSGALTSILGKDYVLHPHNFVHRSGPADQGFHQDGNLPWNERGHYRSHHPDWAILFYYPQQVTLRNGPTEILKGSQYWTTDFEKEDGDWHRGDPIDRTEKRNLLGGDDLQQRDLQLEQEIQSLGVPDVERLFLTLPKGSAVICNYDIFHRGSRSLEGQASRYMYKFHFMRTTMPESAAWDHRNSDLKLEDVRKELHPVINHIWNWGKGGLSEEKDTTTKIDVDELRGALRSPDESKRIETAYLLAVIQNSEGEGLLFDALEDDLESTRRAGCYGIKASKVPDIERLIKLTHAERISTRRMAVYALGSHVLLNEKEVVAALIERLKFDEDDLVRSNSAYALGQVVREARHHASEIIDVLIERLCPGVELDNTEVALMPRSTVRQSIAYALVQASANHEFTNQQLSNLIDAGLDDNDRYVQGLTVETLRMVKEVEKQTVDRVLTVLSRTRLSQTPVWVEEGSTQ